MWLMILFYNSINQYFILKAPMAILLYLRDPNSTLVYNNYSISSALVCSL